MRKSNFENLKMIDIRQILIILFSISIFISPSFEVLKFNLQLTEILLILLFMFFINDILFNRKFLINKNYITLYVFSFLLLILFLISTLAANNLFLSFKGLVKWTLGIFILFYFPKILIYYRWKNVFNIFVLVGNIFLVSSLLIVFINSEISQSGFGALGFHSNQWGQFSLVLLILNFSNLLRKKIY